VFEYLGYSALPPPINSLSHVYVLLKKHIKKKKQKNRENLEKNKKLKHGKMLNQNYLFAK